MRYSMSPQAMQLPASLIYNIKHSTLLTKRQLPLFAPVRLGRYSQMACSHRKHSPLDNYELNIHPRNMFLIAADRRRFTDAKPNTRLDETACLTLLSLAPGSARRPRSSGGPRRRATRRGRRPGSPCGTDPPRAL